MQPLIHQYSLNSAVLPLCTNIKDLGVTFDNKMSFNVHITNITTKAYKMLGFIQRTSTDLSVLTFRNLYCSFVRSLLEYCSVVWSPSYAVYVEVIERVQRKFLRILAFKCGYQREDYQYDDILFQFNLQSLQTRRQIAELCFLYNVLNGGIQCPQLLALVPFNVSVRRGRSTNLFVVPFHPTNYGKNNPFTRILDRANKLSNRCGDVDFFNSKLVRFKSFLRNKL